MFKWKVSKFLIFLWELKNVKRCTNSCVKTVSSNWSFYADHTIHAIYFVLFIHRHVFSLGCLKPQLLECFFSCYFEELLVVVVIVYWPPWFVFQVSLQLEFGEYCCQRANTIYWTVSVCNIKHTRNHHWLGNHIDLPCWTGLWSFC